MQAAMSENMSDHSDPGDKYISAYTSWASGGWGANLTGIPSASTTASLSNTLIVGNVEVSAIYREADDTIAVPQSVTQQTRDAWTKWALAAQREDTAGIVQIVHAGRQALGGTGGRGFFGKSIAPSAIGVKLGNNPLERLFSSMVFGTPREMTVEEIGEVAQQFAAAAKLAHESGFKGVEIHAAHGYLLSSFLSPKMNQRHDEYGGTAAKRARIVIEVIRAVRKAVPTSFCVGLKINSADVGGAESLEESLEQVGLIIAEQIDFIEISGGTYENVRFAEGDNPGSTRTAQREAFFLDYARAVRERYPNVTLMVTGGFRSRKGMEAAIESNSCDLIGIGRPAAAFPHLPKDLLLNMDVEDIDAVVELAKVTGNWFVRMLPIKFINLGMDTLYYAAQIRKMGIGQVPKPPPTS
ncbi:NADH:flavin oxidoreductase/NADH oxidase-like protein [Lophiotrema nucula]|uniref:NADH:flavin oxidoreductase/NADH oxidase-like protein n=1 Tax=Lophiotrema nucula TaxID=690887 RepID=A0A6A5ZGR6_9PLEO|nr:NADH:flavin oxidoreductase/NADH oxidase-like protein [Lophiotrema nucula]